MTHAPVDTGLRTLPYRWYTDPRVAEIERERIFRGTWQYAGHLGELDGPASFFPTRTGGLPVVVTRDADDTLRAFVNVCRHRGALVATGPAKRGTLQCPYHAWTYGLDGALRAAPRSDLEPCFDKDALGLLPVSVDTWGPFVFVNPDPDAEPLAVALGDLPEVVAGHGLDVDALEFRRRYPVRAARTGRSRSRTTSSATTARSTIRGSSRRRRPRAAPRDRADAPEPVQPGPPGPSPAARRARRAAGQFHMLLPNMKFNVSPGRPNLSIGPLWPVAPDRCRGLLDYFFAPGVSEEWLAEFPPWDFQVGAEDIALVEGVQAGAASGALADGRLLEVTEGLIAAFQAYVRARVEPEL